MITKLKITPLAEPRENGIVGFATATFSDTVTVNSISIRQKADKSGLYVRMPMKKTTDGNYIDVVHPISTDSRKALNDAILLAYESGNYIQDFPQENHNTKISAQNCVKYAEGKYGNAIGRVDVVVDDMVIHNCRICMTENGEPTINLPSYKDKEGNYHSICVPHDKEAYQSIRNASMEEYNTEYMFKDVTPKEIEALKKTDIPIKIREKYSTAAIKFNANDLQRVENAIKIANIQQNKIS